MRNIIIFLFMPLTLCPLGQREALKRECMILFESILEIQDKRSINSASMEGLTASKGSGEISSNQYSYFANVWREEEADLRADVSRLYDIAYGKGCFEEGLR